MRAVLLILLPISTIAIAERNEELKTFFRHAQKGNVKEVKKIIQDKSVVSRTDEDGWSALMIATRNNQDEVAKLLLENSASVTAQCKSSGVNALINSARNGNNEIVNLLLDKGSDPNHALFKSKKNALMIAIEAGHFDVVKTLINRGSDLSLQSSDGETALAIATRLNYKGMVRLIQSKQK